MESGAVHSGAVPLSECGKEMEFRQLPSAVLVPLCWNVVGIFDQQCCV